MSAPLMFKHYCGIKRMKPVSAGSNSRQMTTQSVANRCLFLPTPSTVEIANGFTLGTGYDCYFKDVAANVKVGDQLIWSTKVFNVKAVSVYDVPDVGHVHALVTREGI